MNIYLTCMYTLYKLCSCAYPFILVQYCNFKLLFLNIKCSHYPGQANILGTVFNFWSLATQGVEERQLNHLDASAWWIKGSWNSVRVAPVSEGANRITPIAAVRITVNQSITETGRTKSQSLERPSIWLWKGQCYSIKSSDCWFFDRVGTLLPFIARKFKLS